MKAYKVGQKSIYPLKITHYERDLEVQRFVKPRLKLDFVQITDPPCIENEGRHSRDTAILDSICKSPINQVNDEHGTRQNSNPRWRQLNVYVVVQFYPWIKFYFPLFQTHYQLFSIVLCDKSNLVHKSQLKFKPMIFSSTSIRCYNCL